MNTVDRCLVYHAPHFFPYKSFVESSTIVTSLPLCAVVPIWWYKVGSTDNNSHTIVFVIEKRHFSARRTKKKNQHNSGINKTKTITTLKNKENCCMLSSGQIPRRLNFIFRRFGTLCLFHLHRQVGMKDDWVWECWGICIWEKVWLENSLSQSEGGWQGTGGSEYRNRQWRVTTHMGAMGTYVKERGHVSGWAMWW